MVSGEAPEPGASSFDEDIEHSSNDIADPLRNPKAAEAHDLFQNGLSFITYANSPDYDPEVGKHLNGLERQKRNIEVTRKAEALFAAGVTPAQYEEQTRARGEEYDHEVTRQLNGMIQRSGQALGGRLAGLGKTVYRTVS